MTQVLIGQFKWGFMLGGTSSTYNPVDARPRDLTDRALANLDLIPEWMQHDPQIQAAFQAMSNECDRIDEKIAEVTDMFWPQLAVTYLYLWEAALGLTIDPPDLSLLQRQARVMAFLQRRINIVPGSSWVSAVSLLVDSSWSWTRHTPGSVSPPAAHTIQINLPYTSGARRASDLINLLTLITPANTVIVINYDGGFIVQESQVQIQPI